MLFRQIGTRLTLERQVNEAKNTLIRAVTELRAQFPSTTIEVLVHAPRTLWRRETMILGFYDAISARAAEAWIEDHFDVE